MVTPIHLLLFGCRKVEWVDGVIRMDNWFVRKRDISILRLILGTNDFNAKFRCRINLKMDPNTASVIVALRPAIEGLIVRAAKDPESLTSMSLVDQRVIEVIRKLCTFEAGRHGLQKMNMQW